jgi:hypothetical protein
VASSQGFFCTLEETGIAQVEAMQVGALLTIDVLESSQAQDSVVGVNALNASVIAGAGVDETVAAKVDFIASVSQGAIPQDQAGAQMAFTVSLSESVQATDVINRRLLWEPIVVSQDPDWRKIVNTPS